MYFLKHPLTFFNMVIARLATDQITFFVSIAFFALLSITLNHWFWKGLDQRVSQFANESKGGFLKNHSEDFAFFGNAVFHIIFSVFMAIIIFLVKHQIGAALSIFFALIFSWGLNRLVKIIFKRERPKHIVSNVRKRLSYCYPSGHVMASICVYFFSAVLLQGIVSFIPWYVFAFVICFFVIVSRIFLNHHFFTDILGGIALGLFSLTVSIYFYFFVGLLGQT